MSRNFKLQFVVVCIFLLAFSYSDESSIVREIWNRSSLTPKTRREEGAINARAESSFSRLKRDLRNPFRCCAFTLNPI